MAIPNGLKKKLQANLENLSAKEAGRLLLIYTQEADKKGIVWSEYPPTKELWAAYDAMVNKSRGKAEEKAAVNRYNGLTFLARLINSINRNALTMAFATGHDASNAAYQLDKLLFQVIVGDLALTVKNIFQQIPTPVSSEKYKRINRWLEEEDLTSLKGAAEIVVEFMRDDGLLKEEEEVAKIEEIYRLLETAMKKGELAGGEAWDCNFLYDEGRPYAVLIKDGNIPGWIALRAYWRSWLESQDMTLNDDKPGYYELHKFTPHQTHEVIGPDGYPLVYESVIELAEKFYKACRRKAWGKKLIEKPDPALLSAILLQESKPLLYATAPDFGPVNWKQFKKAEEWGEEWATDLYATNKSLTKKIQTLGIVESFNLIQDYDIGYYYVDTLGSGTSAQVHHALSILSMLSFGYQRPRLKQKSESPSLTSLIGIKLSNPIEEAVKETQDVYNFLESVMQAFKLTSDRYFDGLPVVWGQIQAHYERSKTKLEQTRIGLEEQLKRITSYMNDVDIEPLRLAPPTADQAVIDQLVNKIVNEANTNNAAIEELLKD